MNPRHRSHALANSSGSRRNGSPRAKKSYLMVACVVIAVLFSVRRSLSFRSALEQWSSLSAVMTETYEAAEKSSGSFLGAGTANNNANERTVYFLEADASALSDEDLATGMWWQSVASFSKFPVTKVRLQNQNESFGTGVYAVASDIHRDRALMTRDWLDFAVESVGLYHNHFFRTSKHSGGTDATATTAAAAAAKNDDDMMIFYPTLQEQLQTYINIGTNTKDQNSIELNKKASTAPQRTIALIPFTEHGSDSDSTSNKHLSRSQRRNFLELRVQALTATLVSLQRVGIGRAVVVGLSDADKEWALSAFEQVQHDSESSSSSSTMELAFVVAPGLSPEVIQNNQQASFSLPHLLQKQALHGLDVALRGSPSLLGAPIQSWLGEIKSTQWQYVYWTQPNLLLHTRASSLPVLQEALDQGAILTAHRLPIIPHVFDFSVARKVKAKQALTALVPATGSFATIMTLDGDSGACCDAGSARPALDMVQPKCDTSDTPWWQCGLVSAERVGTTAMDTDPHRRKVPYTWMRLQHPGTGIALMAASESARMCTPVASGSCGLAEGSIVTSSSSLISSLSSWAWGALSEQDSDEIIGSKPESLNDDSDEKAVQPNRNVHDSEEIVVVPNRTVLFTKRPEFEDGDP
jgi:hypothetical protein